MPPKTDFLFILFRPIPSNEFGTMLRILMVDSTREECRDIRKNQLIEEFPGFMIKIKPATSADKEDLEGLREWLDSPAYTG